MAERKSAWAGIAQTLSRHKGVTVTTHGTVPCTDGETINIPLASKLLEGASAEALDGLLDHEWGHILENTVAKQRGEKSPQELLHEVNPDKTLHSIWNQLEDIRLEKRIMANYPGCAENLKATFRFVDNKFDRSKLSGLARLLADMYAATYGKGSGYCPEGLVRMALATENAEETLALARKIYAQYQEQQKPKHQTNPKPQGGDEGGDLEGEGEGEAEANGNEDDGEETPRKGKGRKSKAEAEPKGDDSEEGEGEGEEGEGEGGESTEEGEIAEGEGEGEGEGSTEGETEKGKPKTKENQKQGGEVGDKCPELPDSITEGGSEGNLMDLAKELLAKEMLQKTEALCSGDRPHVPYPAAKEKDKWVKVNSDGGNFIRQADTANPDSKKQAAVLLANLRNLLTTQTLAKWQGDKLRGRIDSRNLHRLRTGRMDLFQQKETGREIDTAVMMVLDWSGSMDGPRLYTQLQVVYTLANALDLLGIACRVVAFNSRTDTARRVLEQGKNLGEIYNRFSWFEFIEIKGWNQRAATVVGNFNPSANGGSHDHNCDGEALDILYIDLLARPEKRKILVVTSDGQPNDVGASKGRLRRHLSDTVKKINGQGIEVLGVGIESEHVVEYYPENVVLSAANFGAKLTGKLSEMFLGIKRGRQGAAPANS